MSTPQDPRSFVKEFSTKTCDISVGQHKMAEGQIVYAIQRRQASKKYSVAGSLRSSYEFIHEVAKMERPTIRFEQVGPCNECIQWEITGVEWMEETGEVLTFVAERLNPHWTGGLS